MLFGALIAEAGMILNCSLTWLPEAFKCEAVILADIQKGLLLILHALFGNTPLVHSLQRPDKESYFWLFPYSRGIATAGRSACLIWRMFDLAHFYARCPSWRNPRGIYVPSRNQTTGLSFASWLCKPLHYEDTLLQCPVVFRAEVGN